MTVSSPCTPMRPPGPSLPLTSRLPRMLIIRIWCPNSEVRIILRRPRLRTSEGCGLLNRHTSGWCRSAATHSRLIIMLVDGAGNSGAAAPVTGAIRGAAQATGASFEYLLATAQVESGFNPHAAASTSSAGGLYQFIDQTWLGMLKDAGPGLGYGRYANAIVRSPSGHFEVPDPAMRQEIMALRKNPTANAVMAGAFTQQNSAQLSAQLGRNPSEGELYIAHFLGPAGAAKLIGAAASSPQASAAAMFPGAASANPSIFYDRQGHAHSASDVYGALVRRYDSARAGQMANANVALNAPPIPPADIPLAS